MNAWLLTWDGTAGPALIPDKKIIAILSSRQSATMIAAMVDMLYCRCVDSAYDMASMANRRKDRERQYRHFYSTESRSATATIRASWLEKVTNLRIVHWSSNSELIRWRELPLYGNAPSGSGIVERYPAEDREHRRSLKPLSVDLL